MIRVNELLLHNFGPFRHERIVFPAKNGVVVIYGENMRGKTTLLNAIRFALFGKIVSRGANEIAPAKMLNQVADAEGERTFSITLELSQDADQFTLVRECTVSAPESAAQDPSTRTVSHSVHLARNGDPLGPDEVGGVLESILPEQVSRFFLFDGELLQEYEELLRTESEQGARIAQAIERILGVPLLTGARDHSQLLLDQARAREAKAAQKNAKTQATGLRMAALAEDITSVKSDMREREDALMRDRERRAQLEEELKRGERIGALLADRDRLRKELAAAAADAESASTQLVTIAEESWRTLLASRAKDLEHQIETELRPLEIELGKAQVLAHVREQQERARERGVCAFCGQPLEHGPRDTEGELGLSQSDVKTLGARAAILRSRAAVLSGIAAAGNGPALLEAERARDRASAKRASLAGDLREVDERVAGLDVESHRSAKGAYDDTVKQIALREDAIKQAREHLKRLEEDFRREESRLDASASELLIRERKRSEVLQSLTSLFTAAVHRYRDRLREVVEADASSIFVRLTTESEYSGLSINDHYGLTIQHPGAPVQVRSAGAEHIVALSLISALQRNAPLKGPIFMDSPFGRLDEGHTVRVLRALPELADQIVLLVYTNEVAAATARAELAGALVKEIQLERVSAKETRIREVA